MTKRRTRSERAAEVTRWRQSGLSARVYATERGVSRGSLLRWAAEAGPEFVRVELVEAAAAELVVEVGPARVRVARGFDAELLRDVVAALGSEEPA